MDQGRAQGNKAVNLVWHSNLLGSGTKAPRIRILKSTTQYASHSAIQIGNAILTPMRTNGQTKEPLT